MSNLPGSTQRRAARGGDQLAGIVESLNRRVEYVRQFASPEEAHDAARRDAIDALAAIAKLASGKDIARVLQSVRVTTAMSDAHTAELEPVLLELVTLALTATDGPPGPALTADDFPGWFPPDVVEAAVRAWEAGTTLMMFGLDSSDTFTRIEFASCMREITLRSPVYPHMLLAATLVHGRLGSILTSRRSPQRRSNHSSTRCRS